MFQVSPARGVAHTGITRSEVLVFLVVLDVFVLLSLVPLGRYFERARQERGVENAHTLALLLHQYATDNNDVYPVGEGTRAIGTSEGIALDLLENNFTPDPSVFRVGSTAKYHGNAKDYADLEAKNISWDFTAGATATTGLTSADSDLIPLLYTTGESVDYAKAAHGGSDLQLSGLGPFKNEGVVVGYKAGNAVFIHPVVKDGRGICAGFISPKFKAPGPFSQIRP